MFKIQQKNIKLQYQQFIEYPLLMNNNTTYQVQDEHVDGFPKPKIIINADDYGYCWDRSEGILELIKQRRVSSTSVIINAPNIQQQCQKLINQINTQKSQQQQLHSQKVNGSQKMTMQKIQYNKSSNTAISIGLHLNLTEFQPCSSIKNYKQIPIIDHNKKIFKGKKYIYDNLSNIFLEKDIRIFMETEIRAQIEKFIKLFKMKPSHIDGHNHVHIIPQIAESVCRVARLYGIYRVRMSIPFKLQQLDNSNTLNTFNQIFISLAKQSQKIYDRYGFLYPQYMFGLDTIGKRLTTTLIRTRIQEITNSDRNNVNIANKFIQIMVHPGYRQKKQFQQFQTCIFSKSQQRQLQLATLRSSQFIKIVDNLYSFNDLSKKISQKSILIYSKLTHCTGNLTTSLRLAKILQENMGFRVYLMDVPDFDELQGNQQIRVRNFIIDFSIKLVIGINLTRSAQIIHKATHRIPKSKLGYKIPYILMIAGTDANITLNQDDQTNLQEIDESIRFSQCLVSLSQDMKQRVQSYLKFKKINKQIVLINQSTITSTDPPKKQYNPANTVINCSEQKINGQKGYIVFPTSFRKVKAVHHILPQLNSLISKHDINVYILGPIISKQYYQNTKTQLNNVKYLGCIPHSQYIKMMEKALVLINCSESQGMSCSILQALAGRVPVIARKNKGNCELIQDGQNGFIYEDGSQFIQKFERLLKNYIEIKNKICQKGYQLVKNKFSYEKQIQQYKNLIQCYYMTKSYTIKLPQPKQSMPKNKNLSFELLFLRNVHGVSPVNLKIVDKFFTSHDDASPFQKFFPLILQDNMQNNSNQVNLSILDIGCGCGVFCFYFIANVLMKYSKIHAPKSSNLKIKLNVFFSDLQLQSIQSIKINIRTLQQILQQPENKNFMLKSVTIIQSSMFDQIQKQLPSQKFDIILGNMPQTMFKNAQSRIDKNGGPDGFKLTQILLQNYHKYLKYKTSSILITLFSHMLQQKKYRQILHNNNSKIQWRSSVQIHQIRKQDYEKMQEGLAEIIEQHMNKGKANIIKQQNIFYVPAQLRIIRPI